MDDEYKGKGWENIDDESRYVVRDLNKEREDHEVINIDHTDEL